MDIAALVSNIAHRVWEVDAVRKRLITPATDDDSAVYEEETIPVIVHLDAQDWVVGPSENRARQDAVSVRGDILRSGDELTISDPSAVAVPGTWVVTGKSAESGDGHVTIWRMREKK